MARKSISIELMNNIELLKAWALWRVENENEREIFLRLLDNFVKDGGSNKKN